MRRKLIIPGLLLVLFGCSKGSGPIPTEIGPKVAGKNWRVFEYSKNGTNDPSVVMQQHNFEFRLDYRMYFSQILPVARDTFEFGIADNETIRLTKPWYMNPNNFYKTVKVDSISETDFHFTLTSTENADVHRYKTRKQ